MRTLGLLVLLTAGCSTTTKATLIDKGLRGDKERHEIFEATLRVLDSNPAYVDEFFELTLKHHATLERFTINSARSLSDPKLARLNAMYLRDQPRALKEVMEQILEHSENRPAAQQALSEAMKDAFKDPDKRTTLKETMKDALK